MMSSRLIWTLVLAVLVAGAAGVIVFNSRKPRPPRVFGPPEPVNQSVPPTEDQRVRDRLFELLRPVAVTNCRLERFGERNDGGYVLCGNLLEGVQSAYSYGISGYDGWGCDVSRKLRVPVHEYDCFDARRPECGGGNLIFHEECVGTGKATIEGRLFDSIERQIQTNGDASKNLLVKIDVEGAEWEAFIQTPREVLDRIDQMAVEFHGTREPRFLTAIEKLRETFYIAHLHFNNYSCRPELPPFPAWAYEVLFVNKRIGVSDGSFARAGPLRIDAPNTTVVADCQPPRRLLTR